MNILDIKNRLRQLNAQKYLNDDETEEKAQLLEELALRRSGVRETTKIVQKSPVEPIHKQREHSVVGKTMIKIFKGIISSLKEKPVTEEEVLELQKRVIKYRLKADIEKSKATIRKAKENRFGSISSSTPRRSSGGKTRSDPTDDISSVLRGAVKTKGARFFSDSNPNINRAVWGK